MPELSQGKQFLYRLIVSQLQQDGFVNVATSLSIATIGQTKIIPSDRLSKLISLCAQVVRDTDAEVSAQEKEMSSLNTGTAHLVSKEHSIMGSQHSAFYPALTQIIQDRAASQGDLKEDDNSDENLSTVDKIPEVSQAALKSLQQLQLMKVFSNVTRQAYLQTQALQKKPFFLNNTGYQGPKDPVRPFPLSTPDIKTPQCRSTLLPFSSSPTTSDSFSDINGRKEDDIPDTKQNNIDAMEEIIKQTDVLKNVSMATTTATLPLNFLQDPTDSVIQELLMQRQLKQRRFKDLDCSFVSQLIKPESEVALGRISSEETPSSSSIKHTESLLSAGGLSVSGSGEQARYECPRCARVFAYEYVLQTHMRQVCPDRSNYKHPCTVCKKRFQNQSSLKRHMIVHTGERKYECEVCHKRFGRSHHLKRHVKIHEMEAANYTQHQFQDGGHIPEETLQLILQLGAINNKFPLSPASLLDSSLNEDIMSNCDSIDDGDSQGDVDMEDHISDIGEGPGEVPDETPLNNHIFTSTTLTPMSIQSIINSNASGMYRTEIKKPTAVTLPLLAPSPVPPYPTVTAYPTVTPSVTPSVTPPLAPVCSVQEVQAEMSVLHGQK